ncbi:MAG TPA: glucose PTS transporter subunit IIA [Bdellovibrionota bacterium]|nr:glucose PTS transporter subunit IIA [Bdellovibrionota bacterium]
MKQNKFFSVLQKVGQSLMIPVSVLPAAGLLVALGRMILNATEVAGATPATPIITNVFFHTIGQLCFSGGIAIFEQLSVVFAIGVAIGFTSGAGVAGLAAVVGYFTMANVLVVMQKFLGLESLINTGVFGGIIMGLISAKVYQRFYQTKLHPVFGFFAGKRLVPIVTAGAAILAGVVLGFVWPPIQGVIHDFGTMVTNSFWGPAFYAAGKRLLIPVGLHHVYYPSFLYEFGEFVSSTGQVFRGDSTRYFAGDPNAGLFMASEFPIMLFGLPAAAYAMYRRALPSKRKMIAGVMLSAALTSIITGITEPIEFAFIFVAPVLYVFHVLVAFCSGILISIFDIHQGYTFSASLIDFVLGYFNQKNALKLFLIVGPAIAALYFVVFYWAIGFFNLKTPGRDEDEDSGEASNLKISDKAVEVLKALGGGANIVNLDACITRLRLTVKDGSKVSKARLKDLGASGTLDAGGGNFQVIFGTQSDFLKEEIKALIARGGVVSASSESGVLKSPLKGTVLELSKVPDPTFADKIMGDGVAIEPVDGVVLSPVSGEVVQVFRTNHALGLKTDDGLEILIHIGIDTVKMNGEGFRAFVKAGDRVHAGDKVLEFDLALVKAKAKSAITPIVVTNMDAVASVKIVAGAKVNAGDDLLKVTCK